MKDELLHDAPHAPVHPAMSAAPPDATVLAAVCPPGWRRSPLDGRPVMPCLGKLLFPCEPHEVPTLEQCHDQIAACAMNPVVDRLVTAVLLNAVDDKHRHRHCMNFYDEGAVSSAVDAALRKSWGQVRIRRVAGGWEEVSDAAAAGSSKEASDGEN